MNHRDSEPLSVEAIMQKVTDEVNHRNKITEPIFNTMAPKPKKYALFQQKPQYILHDFNQYHDEIFIQNAFLGILKRRPDPQGKELYLSLLRSGERSKSEILVALRFSNEGKQKNVKILGIKKRKIIAKAYRVPFLGSIIKSFIMFLTLPKLLKRLNQFEAYTHQQLNQQELNKQTELENLNLAIDSKVTKEELEDLSAKMTNDALNISRTVQFRLDQFFMEKKLSIGYDN